jgi:hypothetical protein
MNSVIAAATEALGNPGDIDYPEHGAPKIAGNTHDDDGQVMDDMLKANPDLNGRILPNAPGETNPPKPLAPTRLMTGTVTLLEAGNALKLLSRDMDRIDLSVWITPLETTATEGSITSTGAPVTGPVAFTTETVIAAQPEGWYRITAIVQMSGTTAAADINNMRIATENNVLYLIPINPGTAGTVVTTPPLIAHLNGSETVRVNNPGNATGTAVYQASLIMERIVDTTSLVTYSPIYLASDQASLNGASASALINVPSSPGILRLEKHTGELWASLPNGSVIPAAQISWTVTTK